jgi:His-Xaa-Ser system radical SAM maturase HxsC
VKQARGVANGFSEHIIGIVSRSRFRLPFHGTSVFVTNSSSLKCSGHMAAVSSAEIPTKYVLGRAPNITSVPCEYIEDLHNGDILSLNPDGRVTKLWDLRSRHNVIFVTNLCDCRCLACPQPNAPDPKDIFAQNKWTLKHVPRGSTSPITFTGGEPTLKEKELSTLLEICKKRVCSVPVFLLTNGRRLSNFEFAKRIADINIPNLTFCVSIYGDVDEIHDYCVGAKGAFQETVRGLHNLARLNKQVELRIVIIRNNYRRLLQIAEFIYRNFPFVLHVAFMGMESTGKAWENIKEVWVDPVEYMSQLHAAIQHLHHRNLNTSIYNLPFCLLPRQLWPFSRDSISDWKKILLPICSPCVLREKCPGCFTTSQIQSSYIHPISDSDLRI